MMRIGLVGHACANAVVVDTNASAMPSNARATAFDSRFMDSLLNVGLHAAAGKAESDPTAGRDHRVRARPRIGRVAAMYLIGEMRSLY